MFNRCLGKKKKHTNATVNNISVSPTNEITKSPVSPYNVVFIDTRFGELATKLVNIYTREQAKIVENGWLCGTVPHLDGARFWAPPPNAKLGNENMKMFLGKLRGPVRLMVCTPYGDRFEGNAQNICNLRDLYAAIGRLEIVVFGGPRDSGNYTSGQLYSAGVSWGTGVVTFVHNLYSEDPSFLPHHFLMTSWWGGVTQEYYNSLPQASRDVISSEASRMLNDLEANHGISLEHFDVDHSQPMQLQLGKRG